MRYPLRDCGYRLREHSLAGVKALTLGNNEGGESNSSMLGGHKG